MSCPKFDDSIGICRYLRLPAVVAVAVMLLGDGAGADEPDVVQFQFSQGFTYEDNLYRLADQESAPGGKRHDIVSETGVGLKFERRYSRQYVLADLNLVRARYAIHNELDHDSPDARLVWEWGLGERWSGTLSHSHVERLTGFDEAGGTARNLNVYRRSLAGAHYRWHPRWGVGFGLARTESRFDEELGDVAEFHADTLDLNLTYRPPTGNRAVLTLRDTDGAYPNRPALPGSIRDYRQQEVRLGAEWQVTGATRFTGFVGQTRVAYSLAPERDFSGTIGRLGLVWEATTKTSVAVSVRREIGARQDTAANYAITEAVSLVPKWALSDKVALGAGFEWRRRDYGGDAAADDGIVQAKGVDSSYRYGLHAEYRPMPALSFAVRVQRRERDASNSIGGYSADTADVSMRFRF